MQRAQKAPAGGGLAHQEAPVRSAREQQLALQGEARDFGLMAQQSARQGERARVEQLEAVVEAGADEMGRVRAEGERGDGQGMRGHGASELSEAEAEFCGKRADIDGTKTGLARALTFAREAHRAKQHLNHVPAGGAREDPGRGGAEEAASDRRQLQEAAVGADWRTGADTAAAQRPKPRGRPRET